MDMATAELGLVGTWAAAWSGDTSSCGHSSASRVFPLPSEDRGDTDPADRSRPPGWPGFGHAAPWAGLHQVPQGRSRCQTEDALRGRRHPRCWECVAGALRGQMDLVSHGHPLQRGLGEHEGVVWFPTSPVPLRHPGSGGLRVVRGGCLRGEGHAGVTQRIPGSPL